MTSVTSKVTLELQVLESSAKKSRLGDCFRDLKLTPKNIVEEHAKLVRESDDYDNKEEMYTHEGSVYVIKCSRKLLLFNHECQITVYTYKKN
jgi:hypothetical protein